jgi:AcrR family transcriptional regulator
MATERNPQNTRQRILEAAFDEMHRNGFQGMRIDVVLAKTGLKKGALYHHFSSKLELGYAVLEEIIGKLGKQIWVDPLVDFDNPLEAIINIFINLDNDGCWNFILGCPLNNIAQEMSPVDEGFRERTEHIYQFWQDALVKALSEGQNNHYVKTDVNTEESAIFIVATISGAVGLAKNAQNKELYFSCGRQLSTYLNGLAIAN